MPISVIIRASSPVSGVPPVETPDFLAASTFLAPTLGTVSLLNGPPGTWGLYAQTKAVGGLLQIKRVSHKDTRDATKTWAWTPDKQPPAGIHAIP
jgi:hypothetical protein